VDMITCGGHSLTKLVVQLDGNAPTKAMGTAQHGGWRTINEELGVEKKPPRA